MQTIQSDCICCFDAAWIFACNECILLKGLALGQLRRINTTNWIALHRTDVILTWIPLYRSQQRHETNLNRLSKRNQFLVHVFVLHSFDDFCRSTLFFVFFSVGFFFLLASSIIIIKENLNEFLFSWSFCFVLQKISRVYFGYFASFLCVCAEYTEKSRQRERERQQKIHGKEIKMIIFRRPNKNSY